jgi:hypothetical protein
MVDFDTICGRIKAYEGAAFYQIRGGECRYSVTSSAIKPDRTKQNIPRSHFKEAAQRLPLENTISVHHLRGPSYIYAVLMDHRIRKTDW